MELIRKSDKSIGAVGKELYLTETAVRTWVLQATGCGRGPRAGADDCRAGGTRAATQAGEDSGDGARTFTLTETCANAVAPKEALDPVELAPPESPEQRR